MHHCFNLNAISALQINAAAAANDDDGDRPNIYLKTL